MASDVIILSLKHEAGLTVSVASPGHRRVIRRGKHGPSIKPEFCLWRMPPGDKAADYMVFSFAIPSDKLVHWTKTKARPTGYVVARDAKTALKAATEHFNKVAARSSGLARNALTRAMRGISTRSAGSMVGSLPARRTAERPGIVSVSKGSIGDGGYKVWVNDNLDYAVDAVKGGTFGIERALRSSANSVNGRINNFIRTHSREFWDDKADFSPMSTPFPEVSRRGK